MITEKDLGTNIADNFEKNINRQKNDNTRSSREKWKYKVGGKFISK